MTNNNQDPLRACPLCGGDQIAISPDREFGDVTWDVICKACGCTVRRDAEEQAIAAWNTRAPDPALRIAREALAGYRAAVSWIGADSWDGCPDCVEILRLAAAADYERGDMTPDEIARELQRLRSHGSRRTGTVRKHQALAHLDQQERGK